MKKLYNTESKNKLHEYITLTGNSFRGEGGFWVGFFFTVQSVIPKHSNVLLVAAINHVYNIFFFLFFNFENPWHMVHQVISYTVI